MKKTSNFWNYQEEGSTNIPKSRSHLQILGAEKVIQSKVHTEDPEL
jgi:hypothetical protein